MNIDFVGTVYSSKVKNRKGDFSYMLKREYQNKLFLYNENSKQWKDNGDLSIGGGNSFLRPFRIDNNGNKTRENSPKSLGIPTGPNWIRLTPENIKIIDAALLNIELEIKNGNYQEIWWSSGMDGMIGNSIFITGTEVKIYITGKLMEICKKINGNNWLNHFYYYPDLPVQQVVVINQIYQGYLEI